MFTHSTSRFQIIISGLMLVSISIGLSLSWLRASVYAQDPPTPTPALDPVHRANVELTEAQISNVRGLPIVAVNKQAVVRETLDQLVQTDLASRYTPEDARRDQAFYQSLGFMPFGGNLYNLATGVVITAPTDYYDPATNTIYVMPVNDSGVLTLSETMRYGENYAYALLENQFGAFSTLAAIGNTDQAMAMRAIIEGDMQLTLEQLAELFIASGTYSLESLLTQAASNRTRDLPSSPPAIMVEEAYFGPQVGYNFVRGLYDETDTWRLVNLIYERPPLSTEHILHPTLYLLYETPEVVAVAPLDTFWEAHTETNWQRIDNRVAGEFYLREHLAQFLDREKVELMATGWGGDQMLLYTAPETERANNLVMVWRISFDSTSDFTEFAQHYGEFLNSWLIVAGTPEAGGMMCWEGGERSICTTTLQDDMLIVSAPTLDLAQAILQFQFNTLSAVFG